MQKVAAASLYVVAKQTRLDQTTGETLQVAQVVINPAYSPASFAGDAAVLVLKGRTTAPAIALADPAFEASAVNANAWDWTAGWGSTTPNVPAAGNEGARWPNQLLATALRISTPAACNARYGVTYFTSSNLCVGRDDSTFCNGDSGGPHVVQAADGTWSADRHHELHAPQARRVRPQLGLHQELRSGRAGRSADRWIRGIAKTYRRRAPSPPPPAPSSATSSHRR